VSARRKRFVPGGEEEDERNHVTASALFLPRSMIAVDLPSVAALSSCRRHHLRAYCWSRFHHGLGRAVPRRSEHPGAAELVYRAPSARSALLVSYIRKPAQHWKTLEKTEVARPGLPQPTTVPARALAQRVRRRERLGQSRAQPLTVDPRPWCCSRCSVAVHRHHYWH
jgi:hypothetical protein